MSNAKTSTGIALLLVGLGLFLFSLAVDNYVNIEKIPGAWAHMFFSWFFILGICSIILTLVNKNFGIDRHGILIFSIVFTLIGLAGNAITLLFTHPPDGTIAGNFYYFGHGMSIIGISLLLLGIHHKYNDDYENDFAELGTIMAGFFFTMFGLCVIVLTGIVDLIHHGVIAIMDIGLNWTLITYSVGIILLIIGLIIYINSLKSRGR